jgi:serine/threonine protein kinase
MNKICSQVPVIHQIISLEALSGKKYLICKECEGGMGIVLQLVPIQGIDVGTVLALKTIKQDFDPQSFERECEIWLTLSTHPNIAKAKLFGYRGSTPVIISEWYEHSLADFGTKDLNADKLLSISHDVASALSFAQESHEIIHQDIKPANILLNAEFRAFVADFGLARCLKPIEQRDHSIFPTSLIYKSTMASGHICGTPFFMAPELWEGSAANIKTDIFSYGITFFLLLSGQHPYYDSQGSWREKTIVSSAFNQLIKQHGRVILPLLRTIEDCISLNPISRPSSFEHVLTTLQTNTGIASKLAVEETIDEIVAKASLYRQQGKLDHCEALLTKALSNDSNNPILLNSLAFLREKQGDKESAYQALAKGTESLRHLQFKWKGKVYTDPVLNLSLYLLNDDQFGRAAELLNELWVALSSSDRDMVSTFYSEFGWMHLYRSEFDDAVNYLISIMSRKVLEGKAWLWLCEAAYLADRMSELAERLGKSLVKNGIADSNHVICAILLSNYVSKSLSKSLIEKCHRDHGEYTLQLLSQLDSVEKPHDAPDNWSNVECLIASVDLEETGGVHLGIL